MSLDKSPHTQKQVETWSMLQFMDLPKIYKKKKEIPVQKRKKFLNGAILKKSGMVHD